MADIQARRSASRDSKHDMAYSLANVLNQPSMHILIWEEEGAFIAKCLDIHEDAYQRVLRAMKL